MTLSDRGFSLIELMVAIAISVIVATFIFSAFIFQNKSYITQDQVVKLQQNNRASIDLMVRDIRMAGYDPTNNAGATIIAATANTITFTLDANADETLDSDGNGLFDTDEAITYALYDSPLDSDTLIDDLGRDPDGLSALGGGTATFQPVAENIEAMEFWYTLANGTQTTSPTSPNDIRTIQIWILAKTDRAVSDFNDTRIYTTPSGQTINGGNPFNDKFRRRIITTTIQCRNMGL
jgi:type IV pilus assembly protein PilW